MERDNVDGLTLLGNKQTEYKVEGPSSEILETFDNPRINRDYEIQLEFKEFTSLCPKTGQPDFATLRIRYVPDERCVETKSLKLYLFSFRQEGAFMERIANRILDDLVKAMHPRCCEVTMTFATRGGIDLTVCADYDIDEDERARKKVDADRVTRDLVEVLEALRIQLISNQKPVV